MTVMSDDTAGQGTSGGTDDSGRNPYQGPNTPPTGGAGHRTPDQQEGAQPQGQGQGTGTPGQWASSGDAGSSPVNDPWGAPPQSGEGSSPWSGSAAASGEQPGGTQPDGTQPMNQGGGNQRNAGQPQGWWTPPPLPQDQMWGTPLGGVQPPPPPSSSKNRGRGGKVFAGIVALVLVAIGGGAVGAALAGSGPGRSTPITAQTVATSGSTPSEQLSKVAAAVQPSVVSITVRGSSQSDEGSGVVYKSDGTVITNNHVIAAAAGGSGSIKVKFASGKVADASIVGRDPSTDLAVIKAKGVSNAQPVTFAKNDDVHVGDSVLAIGSPLGLEGSVSSGIVSALHRSVNLGAQENPGGSDQGGSGQGGTNPYGQLGQGGQQPQQQAQPSAVVSDAVQTDAAVNPGNSGGPLVDLRGHVIGINTAIASLGQGGASAGQSGSIGVGFAIPVDEVKTVAGQLDRGEKPKHALLGVQISDAPQGGALVSSVTSGGGASSAGLKVGDVITKFSGKDVGGADELTAAVRSANPGDKVKITFTRSGSTKTTTVKLGSATN